MSQVEADVLSAARWIDHPAKALVCERHQILESRVKFRISLKKLVGTFGLTKLKIHTPEDITIILTGMMRRISFSAASNQSEAQD
jgi:hypothetical protein